MIDVDRLQDAIEAALNPEIRGQRLHGDWSRGGSLAASAPPDGTPLTEPVAPTRKTSGPRPAPAAEGIEGRAGGQDLEWVQRYWAVLDAGSEDACYEMLDHCRHRAYLDGDMVWRSMLALLSAHMGRSQEAVAELDVVARHYLGAPVAGGAAGAAAPLSSMDPEALDVITNLAEVAALVADPVWCAPVLDRLAGVSGALDVEGRGGIPKGVVAGYRALVADACGRPRQAEADFSAAAQTLRARGNRHALARTLHEWSRSVAERDPACAELLAGEAAHVAAEVGMCLGSAPPAPVDPPAEGDDLGGAVAYWRPSPIHSSRPGWMTG